MTNTLVTRMQAVQPPVIPVVGQLIRQHPGTISLGQGMVAYGPPPQAIESARAALQEHTTHQYQAVEGLLPLREAIAHKLQTENQMKLRGHSQVVVTAGSNMGFINAILAITQPGDEIILQIPYYFNHEMAITMASCRAVGVPTDQAYQLQLDAIAAAISPKTRAIVTVSPNNPSGAVYPAEHLEAVNQLCRDRTLYHISDEAYEYFTYDAATHVSPATFDPQGEHTISLFTLSKAYGFAGWRIGYMVIPDHLLQAIQKIQDTILICPPLISQYGAIGALQAGRAYCRAQMTMIGTAREHVLHALTQIPDFCTLPPTAGALYVLPQIHTQWPVMTVVERLIREHGVAVMPGDAFGLTSECYVRIAYGALPADQIAAGVTRFVEGIQEL